MSTECILMHIDRTHEITVALETAGAADPISAFGLVFMPAYRTPATGSSFGAGEAHDVGLFRFVREVVDILAIFPQGHPLVVMPALILIAHAMWVADEERTGVVLNAKVDNLPGGFMARITDTTLSPTTLLVLGALQLLPSARILLATGLLPGDFAKLLIALPFEGTDTASGHHECLGGRGSHSS